MIKDCQSHGAKSMGNGIIFRFTETKTYQENIVTRVKTCQSSKRIFKLRIVRLINHR
jgi:hypothetical protein